MKSLLSTLVILMLLAHLVTGSWYVRKCANKLGNCRKACRNGELPTKPATGMCPKGKHCCVLSLKVAGCGGATTEEASTPSEAWAAPGAGPGAGVGPGTGTPTVPGSGLPTVPGAGTRSGAGAGTGSGAGAGTVTPAAPAAASSKGSTAAAP